MSESENTSPVGSVTDRLMRWILLTGDRFQITAAITGLVFGIFLLFGFAGFISLSVSERAVWFLSGTMSGLLTLIAIAVGLNQIVLSQELGSLDDLYDRTKGTFDVHQQIGDTTNVSVSSPQASEFFLQFSNAINNRAGELEAAGEKATNEQLQEEIRDYTETLTEQTDNISADLEDLGFELTDTLIVLLDYHDSWQLHTARRLDATYQNELSETAIEALDELEDLFLELDAARDYIKSLWIQRELAELSRMMLYTGLPAVIVTALGIFIAPEIPGFTIARPIIVVLLSATVAVSLVPLSVLLAYVVRIALIAQRTAAFGPFIPEDEQQRISGQVMTESQKLDE